MSQKVQQTDNRVPGQDVPWYRQFWPWFIIMIPASAVIAGFITLWLAVSRPDHLVVDDGEYQRLNSELKAQAPLRVKTKEESGEPEPSSD